MTCKDCLHYEACRDVYDDLADKNYSHEFDEEDYARISCVNFTERSEWVHLPCKVGDKLFLLLETMYCEHKIVESKCVRIVDNGKGFYYSVYINCPEIGNSLEFYACDFGKEVFFTREEAKKALKEHESNDR